MATNVKAEYARGLDLTFSHLDSDSDLPAHQSSGAATAHHPSPMQIPNSIVSSMPDQTDTNGSGAEMSREDLIDIESVKGIFGWETLDDISIPYILRKKKKFVAVRIVERKLLSKYPNAFPDELGKKDPLISYFITEAEANLLNEINTAHCDFEYGHVPFTVKDLIVDLEEFMDFFKLVKRTFPADILAKISEEVSSLPTPAHKPELSQYCGWLQINNTVSPFILRTDGSKQVRLVPLSVIVYAAGLLTNSGVDGLLPTPQECALLNEACKMAGFDFMFGKNTRLISLSEVLHRCQVQLFELPFQNPLQHARYIDPSMSQSSSSSNSLMGAPASPVPLAAAAHIIGHPAGVKPQRMTMETRPGSATSHNPYIPIFSRQGLHSPQLPAATMWGGSVSPVRMHHTAAHPLNLEASLYSSSQPPLLLDKPGEAGSSTNPVFLGSPWSMVSRAPPPAHANSPLSSVISKTPPVTPDPPGSMLYHCLPPSSLLQSTSCAPLQDFNHSVLRGPSGKQHRSANTNIGHKDQHRFTNPHLGHKEQGAIRYSPPVASLPPPPPYSSSSYSFGMFPPDNSIVSWAEPDRSLHPLTSHYSTQHQSTLLSTQHKTLAHSPHHHRTPSSTVSLSQLPTTSVSQPQTTCSSSRNQTTDLTSNISACLVNGKSISCINVKFPNRAGRFCLVEAVSKLYFPSVPLTEFVKVLQVVLKVDLHECTPQEEAAFVSYYNLPVSKLKCNKIIRVDDLEMYFPQLNYMFSKGSSDTTVFEQSSAGMLSATSATTQKRKANSPLFGGPAGKSAPPKLENVVRKLHQGKSTLQNGETTLKASSSGSVIVIDDE